MTMDTWLHWARGPLFWTAFAFMVLGLARIVLLTGFEALRAYRAAGDKRIPGRRVARETLQWLVPTHRLRNRLPHSVTTLVFHAAVIAVPPLLAGHVELWRQATGLSWPALPNTLATVLTLAGVAAAIAVVIQRAMSRESRELSRFEDHAIPLLVAAVFVSGCLVMHPAWNPFPLAPVLLVHALLADLLLLLVPLTKLSHMVLLPFTQIVSELAWHFPPDAGSRVASTLGKEREPV
jgi:nitrate reductase gamma subunit